MDAREHFQYVAVPNYNEFVQSPSDFRLLGNAILSMNTVAEYLGLDRSGYPPDVSRNERRREAQKIRDILVVLQTYRFAPIHSNMCGTIGLTTSRCPPLALTRMIRPHGK